MPHVAPRPAEQLSARVAQHGDLLGRQIIAVRMRVEALDAQDDELAPGVMAMAPSQQLRETRQRVLICC